MPAKLDEVLGFLLHKDPFFRYESMRFAVDALRAVLTQAETRAVAR